MIGKAKAELKNSTFRKECAGLKIGGMLWMELRLQQSGAVQVIRQNW